MRPPGLWSSDWACDLHGVVAPYHLAVHPGAESLEHLVATAKVPVWLPVPPPRGFGVSGLGWAGDERTGPVATAVCLSGPSPLGGAADWLLVAEEPGTGLGARYAGRPGPDPEADLGGRPEYVIEAAGHETPLWNTPATGDRVAYVGEAMGLWIWLVLHPEAAGMLLMEHPMLRDVRADGLPPGLLHSAPSPRLAAAD